jgi:hypothetical protein
MKFKKIVSVTIYYIDNHYKYNSQALCCQAHKASSKSENLVSEFIYNLKIDYNSDVLKKYILCVCFASDTAPNLSKFCRLLMAKVGTHWHGSAPHTFRHYSQGYI